MRLHLLNDDRPSALRVYHTCAAMLQQELGVGPSPATQALYKRTMHDGSNCRSRPSNQKDHPQSLCSWVARMNGGCCRGVGCRQDAGQTQFVCITGDPGIGKSRLLEELIGWVEAQGFAAAYSARL